MKDCINGVCSVGGFSLCVYEENGVNKLFIKNCMTGSRSNEVTTCFQPKDGNGVECNQFFGDEDKIMFIVSGECHKCKRVVLAVVIYNKKMNTVAVVSKTESDILRRCTSDNEKDVIMSGNILMDLSNIMNEEHSTNYMLNIAFADMLVRVSFEKGEVVTENLVICNGTFNFGAYSGLAVGKVGISNEGEVREVNVTLYTESADDTDYKSVVFYIRDTGVDVITK